MSAVDVLARAVAEAYARNGGNSLKDHYSPTAAVQWMAQALDEVGVAELIEACAECEKLESIFPCAPEEMPDPFAYWAKMKTAYARRSDALARCKGEGA